MTAIKSDSLRIKREWAMPSPWTFSIPAVADFIMRHIQGNRVIDPFSGKSDWADVSNDINPDNAADFHLDAVDFLDLMIQNGERFDTALIDPPYSPRQISECYSNAGLPVSATDTQNARLYKEVKDRIKILMNPGGVVICCGWNSSGMGKSRGYSLDDILLVCHGGAHNDLIVTKETREDTLFDSEAAQ